MIEISKPIGFYQCDHALAPGRWGFRPWTPDQEGYPVRYVLLRQGNDRIGWTDVGIIVLSKAGYKKTSKVDGLACDGLELQYRRDMVAAGYQIKNDQDYAARLQLVAWIERIHHYGDLETVLGEECALHLTSVGDQTIRAELMDAERRGSLRPEWKRLVEGAL